ncbi:ABC transporter ATP-binding protein [Halogeometricum luteum]|uniref:ABC transporter ATP-binding protein n=1 Tax=Halogeometricum luteum TaxID=2950537 RepID=A0ABU2G545_9EURY|nr:ABC transporter ATP-binding protein [Halogeometricum sp. S3BR5-2]MDS0295414.1 ABC transporter ATP-binding protein [Halogeometricum sp. S3BR5-2]
MSHLVLDHLTKVYGAVGENQIVAVDDLSLELAEGEFLVLVGPSGCGKSTTLQCIAGLETVTDGEIRIDGEVVNDQSPEERDIAMVFQSYALYPHMTARENMSFGLRMSTHLSKEEIRDRVESVAETMGITDLLEDKPKELSGGQQQRVALGRAIVREPEVFLLDEPLSNLDAKLRTKMRTEILQIQRRLNVTSVYVTHDQTEAMTMGDRIAILNGGELQQLGTPLECYHKPNNQFVAGFIGEPSMNFFETTRDESVLASRAFDYPLSTEHARLVSECDDVVLGIRPEDISFAETETSHSVTGTVQVVQPQGDVNHIVVDLGGVETDVETEGDVHVDEGSTIRLELPENRIHLFDGQTGDAIVNREEPDDTTPPAVSNA